MNEEFLKCIPKRWICPYCGEWHDWDRSHELGYYDSLLCAVEFECAKTPSDCDKGNYKFNFYKGAIHYSTKMTCRKIYDSICGHIPISSITESEDEPIVTFDVEFTAAENAGRRACDGCRCIDACNFAKLGDKSDGRHMNITLGFEFEQSDYDKYAKTALQARKERQLKEREDALRSKEEALQQQEEDLQSKERKLVERELDLEKKEAIREQTKNKEDAKMAGKDKKRTSIKEMFYERAPKENVEMLKNWTEKYKPVLKWAVPVAAVYGAYRILNSDECDLSVNNVADVCEEKLGFRIEFLENKRALKELMVLGGLSAGSYGLVQALSGIFAYGKDDPEVTAGDISVEELEDGMNKLQTISQKFSWLKPKTENMLPIAFSVILVYVTLHKPMFTGKISNRLRGLTEDLQIKASVYLDLAKSFIQDKFNIDLSNAEEQKKVKVSVFLLAVIGICAFLYGKKVLKNKAGETADESDGGEINKSVEAFIEQAKAIVEKLTPAIYTSIVTLLISKKILTLKDDMDAFEEDDIVAEQEVLTEQEEHESTVEDEVTSDDEITAENEPGEELADQVDPEVAAKESTEE